MVNSRNIAWNAEEEEGEPRDITGNAEEEEKGEPQRYSLKRRRKR